MRLSISRVTRPPAKNNFFPVVLAGKAGKNHRKIEIPARADQELGLLPIHDLAIVNHEDRPGKRA
jgi:hypothetical protein